MQVISKLNSVRIAPRKVRLVAGLLRGSDAIAAKSQLRYTTKRSSGPLEKVIDSALANAENNFGLIRENMIIKDVIVNGGPVLKRFEPKGFGSVSPLAKRTSHITIVLEEKIPGLKSDKKVEKEAKSKKKEEDHEGHDHADNSPKFSSADVKKELGKKEGAVKKVTRKIFQRKSV